MRWWKSGLLIVAVFLSGLAGGVLGVYVADRDSSDATSLAKCARIERLINAAFWSEEMSPELPEAVRTELEGYSLSEALAEGNLARGEPGTEAYIDAMRDFLMLEGGC